MTTKQIALLTAALLVAHTVAAGQEADDERILRFHSDIVAAADGCLTVTETITVRSAGQQIRHGIYRDFPVQYRGRDLSRVAVPFEVLHTQRDGGSEPYRTESRPPFQRVYLGRPDVLVSPGVHTYVLTYRTARQLGFFPDHDELYWNVNGNEWAFPADEVSATVALPQGAAVTGREAYTGPRGAKGQNFTSQTDPQGRAVFRTSRPLAAGEGLTIVVTFPKGVIAPPTRGQQIVWLLQDNVCLVVALAGVLLVAVYYLVAWAFVGRDPPKGTIIPLFGPPAGLCPAAVRYIARMGYDGMCVTADVADMAVRRYLTITETKGAYKLVRKGGAALRDLPDTEQKIANQLLRTRKSIEVEQDNHRDFIQVTSDLRDGLVRQYAGRYFRQNGKYFVAGAILSGLVLVATSLAAGDGGDLTVLFLAIWLAAWSGGCYFLLRLVIGSWRGVLQRDEGGTVRATSFATAIAVTAFSSAFFAAEIAAASYLVAYTTIWILPVLGALALLNAKFHFLLKRPTPEGRRVMDQIDGFQMYLTTAEPDLGAAMPAPQKTPRLFEQFLPYALALGVQAAWAAKFTDVLAAAAAAGTYSPSWYQGRGSSNFSSAGFASSLGASLSGALASAGTSPSSGGSGSGGGGSSGGGGGGGGGGGW
jgi:uncharacterized membrane protein YgcG